MLDPRRVGEHVAGAVLWREGGHQGPLPGELLRCRVGPREGGRVAAGRGRPGEGAGQHPAAVTRQAVLCDAVGC